MGPYSRQALGPPQWVFSHQFTITGYSAVGTSKLQGELAKALSGHKPEFLCFSAGGFVRGVMKRSGSTEIGDFASELTRGGKPDIDRQCDLKTREVGKRNFSIIEGRLSHIFAPHAMHILLTCPIDLCAERRAGDQENPDVSAVRAKLIERDRSDRERYHSFYPGCLWEDHFFDLHLDSECRRPEVLVQHVLDEWPLWHERMRRSAAEVILDEFSSLPLLSLPIDAGI